jgi:hypothetical protein
VCVGGGEGGGACVCDRERDFIKSLFKYRHIRGVLDLKFCSIWVSMALCYNMQSPLWTCYFIMDCEIVSVECRCTKYHISCVHLLTDLGGQATSIDVVQNIIKYLQETTKTSNW